MEREIEKIIKKNAITEFISDFLFDKENYIMFEWMYFDEEDVFNAYDEWKSLPTVAKERRGRWVSSFKEIKGQKVENKNIWWIYLYEDWDLFKIGMTKNIESRNKRFITENPRAKMIHNYKVEQYSKEENRLHKKFSEKRIIWEWFKLSTEDVLYIKNLKDEV